MKCPKLNIGFRGKTDVEAIIDLLKEEATHRGIIDQCVEHERKWLVSKEIITPLIMQGALKSYRRVTRIYASTDPELRLTTSWPGNEDPNGSNTSWKIAHKSKGDLTRQEIEFELSLDSVTTLMPVLEKLIENSCMLTNPIIKMAWNIIFEGHCYQICNVDDGAFYYMELEFDSAEEARAFQMPKELDPYILDEVTSDVFWKMGTYWKNSRQNGEQERYAVMYQNVLKHKMQNRMDEIRSYQRSIRDQEFLTFILGQVMDLATVLGYKSYHPKSDATTLKAVMDEMPMVYPSEKMGVELNEQEYRDYIKLVQREQIHEGLMLIKTAVNLSLEHTSE